MDRRNGKGSIFEKKEKLVFAACLVGFYIFQIKPDQAAAQNPKRRMLISCHLLAWEIPVVQILPATVHEQNRLVGMIILVSNSKECSKISDPLLMLFQKVMHLTGSTHTHIHTDTTSQIFQRRSNSQNETKHIITRSCQWCGCTFRFTFLQLSAA